LAALSYVSPLSFAFALVWERIYGRGFVSFQGSGNGGFAFVRDLAGAIEGDRQLGL